jgi:hypothetical protein
MSVFDVFARAWRWPWFEAGHGESRHHAGHPLRRVGSFGPVPVSRPIQCAEKGARGERRVGRVEDAGAHAVGDQRAHAAFVAVPLGNDRRAQPLRQGIELEVRRRALHLVDQAQHVGRRECAQPLDQRAVAASRRGQRREQAIQRPMLAEVEEFVLALEVVVEIAGREVGSDGDVAHAGGGIAEIAEDARRGAENVDTPGVGAA